MTMPMTTVLVRAWVGGLLGASAMSLATAAERRVRGRLDHPVDYDASHHVVDAVARVLGREPRSSRERRVYFALAHWGYGSGVALAYPALLVATGSRPRAAAAFYLGCQSMATALLPALGRAPSPRSWPEDVVANSLAQHALYVVAVVVVTGPGGAAATSPSRGGPPRTEG